MHWHSRISRFPNGQPGKKLPWLPKTQKLCFGARSILGAKTSTTGKGYAGQCNCRPHRAFLAREDDVAKAKPGAARFLPKAKMPPKYLES